jgi:type IV pilus assembly protein PilQ
MNVIAHVINKFFRQRVSGALIVLSCLTVGPAWGAANGLVAVSVAKGKNDSQIVKIQFKQDVKDEPVAFATSNPNRLVLDFSDTSNAMGRGLEDLNSGIIKSYQAVQSGERARLVINLAGPANYEVRKDKNIVYAVLQGANAKASDSLEAPVKSATANAQHSVKDVEFRRGKNGEGRIEVSLSGAGVGVDIQQKAKSIQVDFLNTSLPSPLQRRLDVADFATPAQLIETFAQDKGTRMVVTPKGKWDYYAYQLGNQFILEVRSLDDPQIAKSAQPIYSGEKLSLNFQNVDVRAVLQVIADFTGLNIIASDTVSGSITLRLKDVPWDQALDIIMRSRGLDKRVSGNVFWIAPRDELAAKEKAELEAKRSMQELEPLVTRSYRLNYVRADDALVVISGGSRRDVSSSDDATCSPSSTGIKAVDAAGGASAVAPTAGQSGLGTNVNRVLSSRGGASHDLTTNTLVVTDTPDKHLAVEEVLRQIDIPMRQVMIEARIVIADDTWARDLGARLGFQASGKSGNNQFGAGTYDSSGTAATGGIGGITTAAPQNINLGLANPAGSLGFTIFNTDAAAILSLELQALESDNRGKIVSNPRVVTTNLRPAVILQGTQIPYQTVSQGGTQTDFKDALLCLLVSPQVLNNDSIILNVEVQKDAQGANTTAGPAINVKRVKTQVRVNNGETAVLGGIFEQTLRSDTDKVPFLGDLPILGHLFKTTHKADDKSEMLIFLTPRLQEDGVLSGLR